MFSMKIKQTKITKKQKYKKIKDPTKFLTSQVKLDIDAVKLVRKVREEFR